jgi:hypothetical protein
MRGAVPPLPNAPSWHGVQLKKQEQLYLLLSFKTPLHSERKQNLVKANEETSS